MATEQKNRRIVTPEFTLSYPALLKPKHNDLNGKDEYSLMALFSEGQDIEPLRQLVRDAAAAKWGPDQKKWPRPFRSPFRDQGEKAKDGVLPEGYVDGAIFVTLRSNNLPGVVGPDNTRILNASEIYAGCICKASVSAYAYGGPGTKFTAGVSLGLQNVQKQRDGKPLGGMRMAPEEEFAPVDGAAEGGGGASAGATAENLI